MKAATRKHPYAPCPATSSFPTPHPSPRQLDNIFIDALVQACSCRRHAPRTSPDQGLFSPSIHLYHKARRRHNYDAGRQIRHLHRNATPVRVPAPRMPLSRDEYMSMVDFYREPFSTQAMFPGAETQLPPPMMHGYTTRQERVSESQDKPLVGIPGPPPQVPPPLASDDRSYNKAAPEAEEGGSIPQLEENSLVAIASPPPEPPDSPDPQSQHHYHPALDKLLKVIKNRNCMHDEAFEAYSALPFQGYHTYRSLIATAYFAVYQSFRRKLEIQCYAISL